MGVTAFKTLLTFGQRPPLGNSSENPDVCPAILWGGGGFFDGRVGYNVTRLGAIGWQGFPACVVDQVPSVLATNNIAASQAAVSGTPLTLVSSTGAGVTVVATATQVWASGNIVPVNSLALDGLPGLVGFGAVLPSTGSTRVSSYDPTKALARNVRITTNGDDSAGFYTIAGADLYGYPMTETVAGVSSGLVSGKKAFKFIYSITPSGTVNSAGVIVGTGDVYGFPILTSEFCFAKIVWGTPATIVTATTGFLAPDATSPATATTGDTRGTYAVQSASDGTKKLQMFTQPSVANCNSNLGMFGVVPA